MRVKKYFEGLSDGLSVLPGALQSTTWSSSKTAGASLSACLIIFLIACAGGDL